MNTEAIARQIVDRLSEAGFIAYYAGGCVRDQLLNLPSSDYDVATDASPEEVQALFEQTVPVGIEFGSIIVVIDSLPTEVTAFRSDIHHHYEGGRRPHRVERATPKEDAERRSFTINGMFFDPIKQEVIDYVGGRADLKAKIVRAIGDPDLRFKEDRLRMIRGVRFTARFQFEIEKETERAIREHAHLLFPAVSMERIWQELHKMAAHSHFPDAMRMLRDFGLLREIFPLVEEVEIDSAKFLEKRPLIAQLLPLFTHLLLEERVEMVQRCKPSKAELQQLEFLTRAEELLKANPKRSVEWVDFYAHKESQLAIDLAGGQGEEHAKWREELKEPIGRKERGERLVTSTMLREAGVEPGPEMGRLLAEAERIAIEQNLNDPRAVLKGLGVGPKP